MTISHHNTKSFELIKVLEGVFKNKLESLKFVKSKDENLVAYGKVGSKDDVRMVVKLVAVGVVFPL